LEGRYEEALAAGNRALETALPLEGMMPFLLTMALGAAGSAYLHISRRFREQAVELHRHALRLLEAPGGAMAGATTWAGVGFCAMILGDYVLAADVFEKGLNYPTMFMLVERPRLLAGTALVALHEGAAERAHSLATTALDLARENKMQHMMPVTSLVVGRVLSAMGRHEEAAAAFSEAEAAALQLGMRPDAASARLEAAGELEALGRPEEAAGKREEARAIFEAIAAGFTDVSLREAYLETALAAA
jgi:tetratricopeptide (TPR) repeat protein